MESGASLLHYHLVEKVGEGGMGLFATTADQLDMTPSPDHARFSPSCSVRHHRR
jgi:hypothetical protein